MSELLQQAELVSQEEAIHFFDKLEPVQPYELTGRWRGRECKTGHPMEGLLHRLNWYGKSFLTNGNAHPLIFRKKDGGLFNLNPNFVPAGFPLVSMPAFLVRPALAALRPFLSTKKTKARIRMIEYRGKVSAAMVYDRIAIIDHFRKIDQNTILGVMDYKGKPEKHQYFFILERNNGKK